MVATTLTRVGGDQRDRMRSSTKVRALTTGILALAVLLLAVGRGGPVAAQVFPGGEPIIVVNGLGEASAPADIAHIQFLISNNGLFDIDMAMETEMAEAMSGSDDTANATPMAEDGEAVENMSEIDPGMPGRMTEADLDPLVQALVDGGVAQDAISVNVSPAGSGYFGPAGAVIAVDLTGPQVANAGDLVTAVIDVADGVGLFLEHAGLEYDLVDCSALIREARAAAIANGREQAAEMAELLDVTLGEVTQVFDYGYTDPTLADDGGCPSSQGTYFGPSDVINTPPFNPDAEPVAEAYAQLNMGFGFEPAAA